MPLALRPLFGDFAGGIEHAYALATLAQVADRHRFDRDDVLLLDDFRHLADLDADAGVVGLLQDVIAKSDYTLDDLRREGFSEAVLESVRSVVVRRRRTSEVPDGDRLARYGAALRILGDSLQ
jgi:hypothetical protein